MRGLEISKQSACVSRNPIIATFAGFCFYRPIQTSKKSTEIQIPREKQYRHIPTHAASSFLRTTTPPSISRVAEPTLNDITLRNVEYGVFPSNNLPHDITIDDDIRPRASLITMTPTKMATDDIWSDTLTHEDPLSAWPASCGFSDHTEQPRAESPTLGNSLSNASI